MNEKLLHTRVVVGLFLIGLFVLVGCQQSASTQRSIASSKSISNAPVSRSISEAQRARIDAATVARWQSMGQHYAESMQAALVRNQAADQARWQAMGQFYVSRADAARARNQAADLARWQALAEFYANRGRLASANR